MSIRGNRLATLLVCGVILAVIGSHALAVEIETVSVEKIWDQGKHNAFTDLIRFHDRWFMTFREADDHVGGDGRLRVLESADGKSWQSAALVAEAGTDLRDPKLSITPDGRLMIVGGGSVYNGTKILQGRQPRVAFSADGHEWTAPVRVLAEGDWLWRVTWHEGKAYGVSYHAGPRTGPEATEEWTLKLFSSADGLQYDLVTPLAVPDRPNETTVRFLDDGRMMALVRREAGNKHAWIGASRPPYREWTWRDSGQQIGGPNFIRLPDGMLVAAGRTYPGGAKTAVGILTPESYRPLVTLASGGDTSYPGLVWHENLLWMSFYSSHEGKTSIYLAKLRVRP